jgi:hypothetical protein
LWTSDGKADKDLLGFDLKIVNEWIRTCLDTHQECNQVDIPSTNAAVSKSHTYRPAQLPTRLIDVEPGTEATTSVRLFESDPLQCGDYLALSYRWGGPQHTVLESLTIGNFLEGISLTTLPLGLQHAIQLTRKLGYRFLWVDALCILQDSGDDKFRELSHMQDYYRNAIMVIQPSGMETVSDGFLGMAKRSPGHPRSTIQITVIEAGDVEQMILLTRDPNFYVSSMEPLNFRAWVLQERLLCPRVLIFPSVGGVVFQCEKAEQFHGELYHTPHSDDSRYRLPHHSGAPYHDFDAEEAHSSWLKIAHDYSQRELSMPADKLVALAGLAGLYSSRYSSQLGKYRFGHWQNFLHIDLCWCVDKHRVQPKIKVERAPSWSWASVDQAEYENHMSPSNNTNCVSHIEIQNHILCLEAPGQLVMKAHLLPLFLSRYIRTEFGCYAAPSLKSERVGQAASDCAEQRLTGWAERLTGWAEQRLTDWAEVCVIPLCSFWDDAKVFNRVEGMLVERNDQGTYRRVGHFVRYENTWDAFLASVETQIITLV